MNTEDSDFAGYLALAIILTPFVIISAMSYLQTWEEVMGIFMIGTGATDAVAIQGMVREARG